MCLPEGHLAVATIPSILQKRRKPGGSVGILLGQTYKFFCAWKIKELHQPKIVSCDNIQASMGHTCAVDISLVCISWPDSNDLVSQGAVPKKAVLGSVRNFPMVSHLLPWANGRQGFPLIQCGQVAIWSWTHPSPPPPYICTRSY